MIDEVFPNPTVQTVVFQIRFPNLFSLENKMGEFQVKIMKDFPDSKLLLTQGVFFAQPKPGDKSIEVPEDLESGSKIWQFVSPKGFTLNVHTNSLDISSQYHKTYRMEGGAKFRDIIQSVTSAFFEVSPIPIVNRTGLRYIDECPIPKKTNRSFRTYYNSVLPLERFNISDVTEMDFKTVVQKGEYFLRYVESLKKGDNGYKLILDFDGFSTEIQPENCLTVTDALHDLILAEFEKTIKEPLYKYMRQAKKATK